jgi:hypothetical protein
VGNPVNIFKRMFRKKLPTLAVYSSQINSDNSFTIFRRGKEFYRSRPFRLKVQAERKCEEWIMDAVKQDWTSRINDDNSFTIAYDGVDVYTSRQFRLRVQAERKAEEYIQKALGIVPKADVILEVQNVVVDSSIFFGK